MEGGWREDGGRIAPLPTPPPSPGRSHAHFLAVPGYDLAGRCDRDISGTHCLMASPFSTTPN